MSSTPSNSKQSTSLPLVESSCLHTYFMLARMRSSLLLLGLGALVSAHPVHNSSSHGAVASESKVCSQIGIDTLKDGGNAADAVS